MSRRPLLLVMPGPPELAFLSRLLGEGEVAFVGVVEPRGETVAVALAEILGARVAPVLAELDPPPGTLALVPAAWRDDPALALLRHAGVEPVTADSYPAPAAPEPPPPPEAPAPAPAAASPAAAAERLLAALLAATGGRSASLMVRCPATGALLVAAAVGVDDAVVRTACLPPGEGLAGRALALGSPLRIAGPHPGGRNDDRLLEAYCFPLQAAGRPLGVVNLARHQGDPPWSADPLAALTAHREALAAAARAVLRARALPEADLRELRDELRELARGARSRAEALSAWAAVLADRTGAEQVGLAVRDAAGVLLAEGDRDGELRALRLAEAPPGWREALASDPCRLAQDEDGACRLFLPLTVPGTAAAAGWVFADAAAAHAFRLGAAPLLRLLEDRLAALETGAGAGEPPASPASPEPPTAVGAEEPAGAEILAPDAFVARLRRELARCERYHTGCAVYAAVAGAAAESLLPGLAAALRSTDSVTAWSGGQVLVLTPEDGQETRRVSRRLGDLLRELAGLPHPPAVRRVVYPGPHSDADAMLRHLLGE